VRKIDPSASSPRSPALASAVSRAMVAPAVNASLNAPAGIATDSSGNVYVADTGNAEFARLLRTARLRRSPAAVPQRRTGSGDNGEHFQTSYIGVDAAGNLYYDNYPSTVRKISTDGTVKTVAGGGRSSADGIQATTALISTQALTVDSAETIYVADYAGSSVRIRKIRGSGVITYRCRQRVLRGM